MAKRLQLLYNKGKIKVISDNPKYKPFEVDPAQITINGRIIWFGREIER